jgi:hypothetical protein
MVVSILNCVAESQSPRGSREFSRLIVQKFNFPPSSNGVSCRIAKSTSGLNALHHSKEICV